MVFEKSRRGVGMCDWRGRPEGACLCRKKQVGWTHRGLLCYLKVRWRADTCVYMRPTSEHGSRGTEVRYPVRRMLEVWTCVGVRIVTLGGQAFASAGRAWMYLWIHRA